MNLGPSELQSLQLTRTFFQALKDDGDKIAHKKQKFPKFKNCYPMKVDDMLKFLDQYDMSVQQQKDSFVRALRTFEMVRTDGFVDFGKDPLK